MGWTKTHNFYHQTSLSLRLIVCLMLLHFSPLLAVETVDSLTINKVEAWDNSVIDYRHPSADTIDYYRSLPEYQYEIAQDPESLWYRLWQWLLQFFRAESGDTNWFNIILISLAVVTFTVIAVFLYGVKIKGLFVFSRSIKNANIGFTSDADNINDSRLDDLLKTFTENKVWREATRLMYLICLRELNNNKLIKWDISKTNRDYYYELPTETLRLNFKQLIVNYEYVWYGNFPVDDSKYHSIKDMFDSMNSLIQTKTFVK